MQTAEIPPTAESVSDAALIVAGMERASFWRYPVDSAYTVSVRLPNKLKDSRPREVQISRDQTGAFTIH